MFHVNNGLYFKRLDDGSVLIVKRTDSHPDSPIVFEQIIDADSWASIVTSVSAYNETALSFQAARKFHAGEIPENYLQAAIGEKTQND